MHLQAELGVHYTVHPLKRRKVHILKSPFGGGSWWGDVEPEVACGRRDWSRRVTAKFGHRVTCWWCQLLLPKSKKVTERTGMAMPRPEPIQRRKAVKKKAIKRAGESLGG